MDVDEPVKVMQVLIQSGCLVGLWMGFIRVEVGPGRVPAETPDSDLPSGELT